MGQPDGSNTRLGCAGRSLTPQPAPQSQAMTLPDPHQHPAAFLRHLYDVAVQRAQPLQGLKEHLPAPPKGRTLVLGAGKAGGSMAQALEALWPADAPISGLVVTRYDHIPPRPTGLAQRIEVVEAAHPVPDAAAHFNHAAQLQRDQRFAQR
eukprot:gene6655-8463_t